MHCLGVQQAAWCARARGRTGAPRSCAAPALMLHGCAGSPAHNTTQVHDCSCRINKGPATQEPRGGGIVQQPVHVLHGCARTGPGVHLPPLNALRLGAHACVHACMHAGLPKLRSLRTHAVAPAQAAPAGDLSPPSP